MIRRFAIRWVERTRGSQLVPQWRCDVIVVVSAGGSITRTRKTSAKLSRHLEGYNEIIDVVVDWFR